MKKGKKATLFVLALEISSIAVLHTIKIKQAEDKTLNNKAMSKNSEMVLQESRMKTNYSLFVGIQ